MSEYRPFDALDAWRVAPINAERWQRVADHVAELQAEPTDFGWLQGPLRAAAYQSGAIEGLHPGDRGLTLTLIESTTEWQSAVAAAPDGGGRAVIEFIDAGVEALHMALDLATNARPVSESWIRQVHAVVCRPQMTYRVNTPAGSQDHALAKGEYKSHDNHVRRADDSMLWFCPASEVPHEMARLVAELQSEAFDRRHPVVQAAFAHQAFTHIHPFADGNGRVARVLASIYLHRAVSLPFFLFADRKPRYIDALAEADDGHPSAITREVLQAAEDLADLLVEAARAARPLEAGGIDLAKWRQRVDELDAFRNSIDDGVERAKSKHRLRPDTVRTDDPIVALIDNTTPPTTVEAGDLPRFKNMHVPFEFQVGPAQVRDVLDVRGDLLGDVTHPLTVRALEAGFELRARSDEVWPTVGMGFALRLDAWLDRVVGDLAAKVARQLDPQ